MSYKLNVGQSIKLPKRANNPFVSELLSNYMYGAKWNVNYTNDDVTIEMGMPTRASYENSNYVVNVNDDGAYISGIDYASTMHGLISFLDNIKYDETQNIHYVENMCLKNSPKIGFRCTHICVFPETGLEFLRKCVRSCALAKYSHIILEFWGMLKYDCMPELSWDFAYDKSAIKEIVAEANALGVEIIPMFNHLGHASACRELSAKHVVLDQNPRLEYLFDSYGWIWKIEREDVKELHRNIRKELMDVCGDGKYFHVGFDEAYSYGTKLDKSTQICEYLNEITEELAKDGRRPIAWHDMFISIRNQCSDYVSFATKEISDMYMSNLNKNIIIADWQYYVKHEVWKSSKFFKENGFDVICCPWDEYDNFVGANETVVSEKLFGIMHTTWHTLNTGFRELVFDGKLSYGECNADQVDFKKFYASHVLRKVMPSNGNYSKSGCTENQIEKTLR